jgi:hypothetical protein
MDETGLTKAGELPTSVPVPGIFKHYGVSERRFLGEGQVDVLWARSIGLHRLLGVGSWRHDRLV